MMSEKSKTPGDVKIKNLLESSLPQRVLSVIGAFEVEYGTRPDRLTVTAGLHALLVTEHPAFLFYLEHEYIVSTYYIPLKDSWSNAVLIVSNDSGTKEAHI